MTPVLAEVGRSSKEKEEKFYYYYHMQFIFFTSIEAAAVSRGS